ncbi:MAG: Mth938-like domain-containing protein [Candidatus Micrarchaeota archaeon]
MIESYSFGKLVIDGMEFRRDLIVFPDRLKADWWRKEGHKLQMADLAEVLAAKPRTLIVGTGHEGTMEVDEEVSEHCKSAGIKLIVCLTEEAVKRYNDMAGPGVIGLFHLTC